MTQHLYLFTIGPVQSFIAAARRTQDLYVGSQILSMIAGAGVQKALTYQVEMLFPYVKGNEIPSGVPHRFAFISSQADPAAIEQAMRKKWLEIESAVRHWLENKIGGGSWEEVYKRQVENWLEVYWVAVEYKAASHAASYEEAGHALAQRKLLRHFPQVHEAGKKCTLSGAQSALPLNWGNLKKAIHDADDVVLRPSEELGALAMIKRFAGQRFANIVDDTSFPDAETISGRHPDDEEGGFLAFLHMDGDSMGKHLSGLDTLEKHRDFSRQLSEFAKKVSKILAEKYKPGVLVYAGGDDVLAILPLQKALACAIELHEAFRKITGLTMSAGIAITPDRLPYASALEASRQMEKLAKGMEGKDALAIQERHGGQLRQARIKWDDLPLILDMQGYFAKDILSGKLAYDVQQLAHDMDGGEVKAEARAAELTRILKRRLADNIRAEDRDAILGEAPKLAALGEEKEIGWAALANWLILARFLAKGGRER
jgi:CRISPR-associated protein Cmr2